MYSNLIRGYTSPTSAVTDRQRCQQQATSYPRLYWCYYIQYPNNVQDSYQQPTIWYPIDYFSPVYPQPENAYSAIVSMDYCEEISRPMRADEVITDEAYRRILKDAGALDVEEDERLRQKEIVAVELNQPTVGVPVALNENEHEEMQTTDDDDDEEEPENENAVDVRKAGGIGSHCVDKAPEDIDMDFEFRVESVCGAKKVFHQEEVERQSLAVRAPIPQEKVAQEEDEQNVDAFERGMQIKLRKKNNSQENEVMPVPENQVVPAAAPVNADQDDVEILHNERQQCDASPTPPADDENRTIEIPLRDRQQRRIAAPAPVAVCQSPVQDYLDEHHFQQQLLLQQQQLLERQHLQHLQQQQELLQLLHLQPQPPQQPRQQLPQQPQQPQQQPQPQQQQQNAPVSIKERLRESEWKNGLLMRQREIDKKEIQRLRVMIEEVKKLTTNIQFISERVGNLNPENPQLDHQRKLISDLLKQPSTSQQAQQPAVQQPRQRKQQVQQQPLQMNQQYPQNQQQLEQQQVQQLQYFQQPQQVVYNQQLQQQYQYQQNPYAYTSAYQQAYQTQGRYGQQGIYEGQQRMAYAQPQACAPYQAYNNGQALQPDYLQPGPSNNQAQQPGPSNSQGIRPNKRRDPSNLNQQNPKRWDGGIQMDNY